MDKCINPNFINGFKSYPCVPRDYRKACFAALREKGVSRREASRIASVSDLRQLKYLTGGIPATEINRLITAATDFEPMPITAALLIDP